MCKTGVDGIHYNVYLLCRIMSMCSVCIILILQSTLSKTATLKKTITWFSRPIIAQCMSKVLQNAPRHSAILLTFIKLPLVIKIFVLSILSGCLGQGLLHLYSVTFIVKCQSK